MLLFLGAVLVVEVQVGVEGEAFFVVVEEAHGFVGLEAVAFDGGVGLGLHLAGELVDIPLGEGEDLADGAAGEDFFDIVAGFLVLIEVDVHFVDAAEEVVKVAHDVLIGAGEEEADVVGVAGVPAVEREGFLHILEVDEFRDFAVRVAGDVHESGVAVWPFVEVVDGHNGEELAERPVVEEGLEDGEVAEVLVADGDFDFPDFFGDVFGVAEKLDDVCGDLPVDGFDAGLGAEVEEAEVEHRLGALADFLGVVEVFEAVLRS